MEQYEYDEEECEESGVVIPQTQTTPQRLPGKERPTPPRAPMPANKPVPAKATPPTKPAPAKATPPTKPAPPKQISLGQHMEYGMQLFAESPSQLAQARTDTSNSNSGFQQLSDKLDQLGKAQSDQTAVLTEMLQTLRELAQSRQI